jgi:hypothetical protein
LEEFAIPEAPSSGALALPETPSSGALALPDTKHPGVITLPMGIVTLDQFVGTLKTTQETRQEIITQTSENAMTKTITTSTITTELTSNGKQIHPPFPPTVQPQIKLLNQPPVKLLNQPPVKLLNQPPIQTPVLVQTPALAQTPVPVQTPVRPTVPARPKPQPPNTTDQPGVQLPSPEETEPVPTTSGVINKTGANLSSTEDKPAPIPNFLAGLASATLKKGADLDETEPVLRNPRPKSLMDSITNGLKSLKPTKHSLQKSKKTSAFNESMLERRRALADNSNDESSDHGVDTWETD